MKKILFNKICIVGVGLIGGSIGLAIKKRKLAKLVTGVVHRRQTLAQALRRGAVHTATMNLKEGVQQADLVILCAPVSTILQQIKVLKPWLDPNACVIDVASSKLLVEGAARKYLRGVNFVGCHPMVGAAESGLAHANGDLFEGATCFVINKDPRIERFWRELGAHSHTLTAKNHDEWVAHVSHLPHILAFALFQSGVAQKLERFGIEASNPSIRDLARLSKSDPKLWADILLSNKEEILKSLQEHEISLRLLKKFLHAHNVKALEKFILQANIFSQRLVPTDKR
jgi:prephenate dehydrogenase